MLEVYFETYGCTANYNSTEILKGLIKQAGLGVTSNENIADFIVINSCVVKEPTEEKIRRRIQDLLKNNKKIIITGCMPYVRKEKYRNLKNIYLLDSSQIKNIVNLFKDIKNNKYEAEKYLPKISDVKLNLPKIPENKVIGVTQISEGCLGKCSYCLTRVSKGKLFSYPKEEIIKSINSDLNSGCKEIWITSQDCASYGLDTGRYLLPELLEGILDIKKKFFLRVGMMNPDNVLKILPEIVEIYKNKKMFKFLHIPVQSGSNNILKKMNRNYTYEDFFKIIREFKRNFPEMHFSTDIIVGYNGEKEEDFKKTYELIEWLRPETINVSRFWPRPGSSDENLKPADKEIMKKRVIQLAKLHKKICNSQQKKFLNWNGEVLVDKKGFANTYLARNENYKLFAVYSKEKILGKRIKVKVKDVTPHYLVSEAEK